MREMLTFQLLKELGIAEDALRGAIRRGRLRPRRLENGLLVWDPAEVERARAFFARRREATTQRAGRCKDGKE